MNEPYIKSKEVFAFCFTYKIILYNIWLGNYEKTQLICSTALMSTFILFLPERKLLKQFSKWWYRVSQVPRSQFSPIIDLIKQYSVNMKLYLETDENFSNRKMEILIFLLRLGKDQQLVLDILSHWCWLHQRKNNVFPHPNTLIMICLMCHCGGGGGGSKRSSLT